MSLFGSVFGTGIVWTRNEAWVLSCGRRTLDGFTPQTPMQPDFPYLRSLPPTKRPRKVLLRLDVDFHIAGGKVIIDDVRMAQKSPNCEVTGSSIHIADACIDRRHVKANIQKEADTKKSWIRTSIVRMLHEEQDRSGRKRVTADG